MKKTLLILLLPALLFASCSEETGEKEEYVNWQNVNELAFKKLYSDAIADTTDNLDTIRCYTFLAKPSAAVEDYIVVKKLDPVKDLVNSQSPAGSPIFTDTVSVSYSGKLLPSTSYADGLVFDKTSDLSVFDSKIARPTKFCAGTLVNGFTTALQHMTVGDRWIVYIPYQLGYGTVASGSKIPAYSMLTFEIILHDFWNKK